jgi:hypothetical protein
LTPDTPTVKELDARPSPRLGASARSPVLTFE